MWRRIKNTRRKRKYAGTQKKNAFKQKSALQIILVHIEQQNSAQVGNSRVTNTTSVLLTELTLTCDQGPVSSVSTMPKPRKK